jgi:hypothetical protein
MRLLNLAPHCEIPPMNVSSLPLVASLRQQLFDRESKDQAESQLIALKRA